MTTRVMVKTAGHAVAITAVDRYRGQETRSTRIVRVGEEPPLHLHATTTRTIEVVDLEPDDSRLAPGELPADTE